MAKLAHLVNDSTEQGRILSEVRKTPEMRRIDELGESVGLHLQQLYGALYQLQQAIASIPTPERPADYSGAINDLKAMIGRLPTSFPTPEKPEKVSVPDYSEALQGLAEKLDNLEFPEIPERVDLSGLEGSLNRGIDDVLKALSSLPKPEKSEPRRWRFQLVYSDIDGDIDEIIAEPI